MQLILFFGVHVPTSCSGRWRKAPKCDLKLFAPSTGIQNVSTVLSNKYFYTNASFSSHGEPGHTVFAVKVVLCQNKALGYTRNVTDADNLSFTLLFVKSIISYTFRLC